MQSDQYEVLVVREQSVGWPLFCVLVPKNALGEQDMMVINDLAEYFCQAVDVLVPDVALTLQEVEAVITENNGDLVEDSPFTTPAAPMPPKPETAPPGMALVDARRLVQVLRFCRRPDGRDVPDAGGRGGPGG